MNESASVTIQYGKEALKTLKTFAEQKDIDICFYLAKNKIDVEINLQRLYDIMSHAEGPEAKEAAKKLFELDFNQDKLNDWAQNKYFRLGYGSENGKERQDSNI